MEILIITMCLNLRKSVMKKRKGLQKLKKITEKSRNVI